MDQEIVVKAVCGAAEEVFATMLGLGMSSGEAYIEENAGADQPSAGGGVVALIGMAGGSWVGTGMLTCTPEFACKAAAIMLLAEYHAVDNEVLDAIAEISNMIFGNVKTVLEEHLGPLGLSIPTVIFGKNFSTRSVGQQMWTVVPLEVGDERMQVRIFLAPQQGRTAPARHGFSRPYAVQCD
ncbi:MAG TPA: chemotaxis protein CheX [Bryobacteraceae bacterium]